MATIADIIAIIHIVIIVFIVGGLILPNKYKKAKRVHGTFMWQVMLLQCICGGKCPLTVVENYLRRLDNPKLVEEPLTKRMLMKLFGVSISEEEIIVLLAIGIAISLWRNRRRG